MSVKRKNHLVTDRAAEVDGRARLEVVLRSALARVALWHKPEQLKALAAALFRDGVTVRPQAAAADLARRREREVSV
jgi:hypothetical protein